MDHKKEMIKLFEKVAYRHNLKSVFCDFVEMAAVSFRSSVDINFRTKGQERYKSIITRYDSKEIMLFTSILGELTIALEEKPKDYLGELFSKFGVGDANKGQFFTPYHLCLAAVKLVIDENIEEEIKQKGFITLDEPSCGAGAMIIAFSEAMKEKKLDPQRQLKVTAKDLDIRAVHMAYVQLSLLGIPAQICHANTLSLKVFDTWKTPIFVLDGWGYKNQTKDIEE